MHCDEPPGDVLVFLTGQDEIESLEKLLSDRAAGLATSEAAAGLRLVPVPIYASLPPEQQMKVGGRRGVGGGISGWYVYGGTSVCHVHCPFPLPPPPRVPTPPTPPTRPPSPPRPGV